MKNIEQELISGCKRYKLSAQKKVFECYAPRLKYACKRYIKDENEINDVLQEGFLKVFNKIKQFNNHGSFEGWIRRIIINTAIEHIKKSKKYHNEISLDEYREFVSADEITNHLDGPQIDAKDIDKSAMDYGFVDDADFSKEELLHAIQLLPKEFRLVFNLYVIEGYKHREIANILDIDENTSRSRLSRARKILQGRLYEMCIKKLAR